MPNKLKYYIDKKSGKKTYTLKSQIENKPTKDAHYKFLKLKDVTRS